MLMSSWYYQQAQTAVRALHLFAPGCALAPAKVPGRGQLWMSVEADGVIMGSRSLQLWPSRFDLSVSGRPPAASEGVGPPRLKTKTSSKTAKISLRERHCR